MDALECPNCHAKSVSFWRKMFLGPATSVACPKCNASLSVPMSSLLAAVPLIIPLAALQFIQSFAVAAVLIAIGFLAMCWLHYTFVPLIVKAKP